MPYEHSPSPVAPSLSSRMWTAGASGGVAIAVLLVLAALNPELALWLTVGAAIVAVSTWMVSMRREPTPIEPTPLVQAAEVEQASSGLLNAVFEALRDPVLIVSGREADDVAGGRVVLANAAARDLFRIPREGARLVSVIRDPGVLEIADEALFGGVERTTDYAAVGAHDRHWRALARPLPPEGDDALALLVLRDETDVRRMELMRVDFLANASHELRTPLASLSGFIETLKGHAREDDAARDRFLDIMAVQAERMSRLVADLLSLSRIELNEHIPPAGKVDLSRAVSDVADAVSVLTAERKVGVRIEGAAIRTPVTGDRDQIVQVVQNLVDNAVKYSPSGGVVEVAVRAGVTPDVTPETVIPGATRLSLLTPDHQAGQRYAQVTVRDHGPGMAREHLPRLTERFYRVEGQKSGERLGTGLGLAIVKHIVNRHRGGLTVESAPGQGAAFTAYFPMPPAKDVQEADGPAT